MPREIPEFDLGELAPQKLARCTIHGRAYVLIEAPESAAAAYRNAVARSMRMAGGENQQNTLVGFDGAAEADAELLAACLKESETGKPGFTAAKIRSWPASAVAPLVELLKRGSGLLAEPEKPAGEGGEGGEGNSPAGGETPPGDTPDTSGSPTD